MAKSHKTCMERLLCHVLLELTYTFEHIWTNLLTQCTQLPVPVFSYFCISGFPAIKSAPKIPEKLYKKSASRKPPETPRKEGRATTRTPKGSMVRPSPRPHQAPSWLPGGPSRCPLWPLFLPPRRKPLISKYFFQKRFRSPPPSKTSFGGHQDPAPAPYRGGPSSSTLLPPHDAS